MGGLKFSLLFLAGLGLTAFFEACSGKLTPSIPAPLPTATATSDPTLTPFPTLANSPTLTPTLSPTGSPSKTQTFTPSPTLANSATPTTSPTISPSCTQTFTPTITFTPGNTSTACFTFTATATPCVVPTPPCVITGSITYTGTSVVDSTHQLLVGLSGASGLSDYYYRSGVTSGTYTLQSAATGIGTIAAYYNYNGLGNNNFSYGTENFYPVPGERYTGSGSYTSPAVIVTYPVTFVAGSSAGPNITIDDSSSFSGFYGTATYTGKRGTVQYCRPIHISTYSDPGYSSLLQPGATVQLNGAAYSVVTNTGTNPTGLTAIYVRAWFDVNGNYNFGTGDPYMDLGLLTPSANGLVQNITFNDTYVK